MKRYYDYCTTAVTVATEALLTVTVLTGHLIVVVMRIYEIRVFIVT